MLQEIFFIPCGSEIHIPHYHDFDIHNRFSGCFNQATANINYKTEMQDT